MTQGSDGRAADALPAGSAPVRVDVTWWDLPELEADIEALRSDLAVEAAVWAQVPGLRTKLWIVDRERGRWGAVMIWDAPRPPIARLPPNRALELIGRPPAARASFDVELAVDGVRAAPPAPSAAEPQE